MEELRLDDLGENEWGKEVSEEEKKKASEDSKWAAQARKQIQKQQAHNYKFAVFLSKVLERYYMDVKIIDYLYKLLPHLEENEQFIIDIFLPFVNSNKFVSISDYVDYLKKKKVDFKDFKKDLVFQVIEFEKLGGDELWKSLKKGYSTISYEDFKKEILDELWD